MRGEDGANYSAARSANHDAYKGGNSARRPSEETGTRTGRRANGRPDASSGYETYQGMLAALGAGGCRDTRNAFSLY